ncbi:hypothetical protein SCLCIDRAFT_1214472 [Scleroderma citrinum Foug A]|uniref:Uncharacterized protein n=1 Tax=Scleroderma citrinum Foug A TaxID=1036808 RepID=A0A0C3AE19_9AGAM|nr:hypothetical protein SCLCIDRAFT_1214472 [Scleroderma citrinum Foug A]
MRLLEKGVNFSSDFVASQGAIPASEVPSPPRCFCARKFLTQKKTLSLSMITSLKGLISQETDVFPNAWIPSIELNGHNLIVRRLVCTVMFGKR